ncbi:hypothetical protein EJ04DRAFT_28479 [Polyplosphaeria fusca]|uniref:Uncharacterized protein n=1 Tax=Polyplosphaeria fusca TaxID=682080 RepID=A0A9P4QU14_9PLEO|nr:hypothetical protein EJ04DRAFT_28479 [Polyplosphaeria fusca]
MPKPRKGYSQIDHGKAVRAFAEDAPSSDIESDGDLDIIGETRKELDISQYIDEVSQHPKQTQGDMVEDSEDSLDGIFDEDIDRNRRKPTRPLNNNLRRGEETEEEATADEKPTKIESDHELDEIFDPGAAYREFNERKTAKRKRVAAETNRIRAAKKSKAAAATSIIGRKPTKKRQGDDARGQNPYSISEAEETYLDDPTPEYIEARRKEIKKLHEAGLRYPPNYDDIDFSNEMKRELEEKPVFDKAVKAQRPKKDMNMRKSGGIIPAPIAQWLRDYQVDGVKFLHEKFVQQTGAILGDDMGLGKTIQVIAFLTAAFGKLGTSLDAKLMRTVRRRHDDRWYPRVLIVCPGTLMQNWQDELEKWGWWQVYVYHGAPDERRAALEAVKNGMAEIIITTYATYRLNESQINTIDWDCVIADECHQIKSKAAAITKAMNKVNALCRIGLTGTAIQNKYDELWCLLNWARPGHFGSAQSWRQLVSIPLKLGQSHEATNAQLASARLKAKELVETILPDMFLRRMKTLIADQLPRKVDHVVFCQLTDTQAEAYRALLDSERFTYIRLVYEDCDCNSGRKRGWCCYQEFSDGKKWIHYIFPCMVTLSKLANHLALLVPSSSDPQEKITKDMEYLQVALPDQYKDLYRDRDKIMHLSQREYCGKWKVLKRLLHFWHTNGDKVLVFSHSVRLLRLMKSLFDIDGTKYNFSYLDGSMSYDDRAKAVADFNSNPSQFVFLISTKAGGVGLNITSANKVVVVDPNWNPAYDLQAQDRAYRIGQTRDVEVFRLISAGTIEEIVYARQIYKQQQANIGYTASDERRYFKGVQDMSGQKGELFGLANLFSFEENGQLLRDVVHKTNIAETRAGVLAMATQLPDADDDSDEDMSFLSNASLGLADDKEFSQMKKVADAFAAGGSPKRGVKYKNVSVKGNPINAILAKAGVQYTHENSEIIGRSSVEAELARKAVEVRNDMELSRKKVFHLSQSQEQSREPQEEVEDREEEDMEGAGEFKINYRYRPDESVRRRQFCEIARTMGYEDPVEFALRVEDMGLEERRGVLERFYRRRRREFGV